MPHSPELGEQPDTSTDQTQLHGVLIRVADVGVLLTGNSGIGKSECALELIEKGHQLVADDVVAITRTDDSVVGRSPALTFELLEIRGLGIINVRQLFGDAAVLNESRIDLCIELSKDAEVDRLDGALSESCIAGCEIPQFVLPVNSGRNLSTLVETAVRIFRQHDRGAGTAELLMQKHQNLLDSLS